MECHSSDSKKLTKVFDASLRKRSKKKRDGLDDTNSVATDDSTLGCLQSNCRGPSEKASVPELSTAHTTQQEIHFSKRDSSPSQAHSPVDGHRSCMRSRRKHRKPVKDGISLALKAGLNSTPRSGSPLLEGDGIESIPQDQDSFIYTFLEEAIKRDKKKQRHAKRREERHSSPQREASPPRRESPEHERERGRERERERAHHRHHHRHKEQPSRDREMQPKEITSNLPPINQAALFETFAKMCAQITEKNSQHHRPTSPVTRCQSHKSLQCEVVPRRSSHEADRQPVRLKSHSRSRDIVVNKIRSQENCSNRVRSHETVYPLNEIDRCKQDKYMYYYEKNAPKYSSKLEISRSRMRPCEDERYRDYPPIIAPTRSCIDPCRRHLENRDYRDYNRDSRKRYDDDNRKYCEQKFSRSFEIHREYHDEDRFRRTARSDPRERRYDNRDKRYDDMGKYYDEKSRDRIINTPNKDRRCRKNLERFERISTTSRDDDKDRERDRYSERERDSGLSVADGDTSTVSGRSNYLKMVKQQICEQRDAMDKMMNLWKELMRCFKCISQTQGKDQNVRESAANVQESAAEQMRLWWECMRRYETVARDVGDTDARLMEEIKKQRSEMAEMANMWQECLQRYRDISNDFNNLKQQLKTPESPTRLPAPPLLCAAEGEGSIATAAYRLPTTYPPVTAVPAIPTGGIPPACIPGGYIRGMSPVHGRASVPPAWWWNDAQPRSPRRRSSPDSRASMERDKGRRHRHKEENTRYKEKSSKPSAARSEHRHRKR